MDKKTRSDSRNSTTGLWICIQAKFHGQTFSSQNNVWPHRPIVIESLESSYRTKACVRSYCTHTYCKHLCVYSTHAFTWFSLCSVTVCRGPTHKTQLVRRKTDVERHWNGILAIMLYRENYDKTDRGSVWSRKLDRKVWCHRLALLCLTEELGQHRLGVWGHRHWAGRLEAEYVMSERLLVWYHRDCVHMRLTVCVVS
jgi:hypothetical protein